MAGERLSDLDRAIEFLADLPLQGGGRFLTLFHLSAGEFPGAGEMLSGSPLTEQDLVVTKDDGTDDLKHGGCIAREWNNHHPCRVPPGGWKDERCSRAGWI